MQRLKQSLMAMDLMVCGATDSTARLQGDFRLPKTCGARAQLSCDAYYLWRLTPRGNGTLNVPSSLESGSLSRFYCPNPKQ
jgi:hypothetical protein